MIEMMRRWELPGRGASGIGCRAGSAGGVGLEVMEAKLAAAAAATALAGPMGWLLTGVADQSCGTAAASLKQTVARSEKLIAGRGQDCSRCASTHCMQHSKMTETNQKSGTPEPRIRGERERGRDVEGPPDGRPLRE